MAAAKVKTLDKAVRAPEGQRHSRKPAAEPTAFLADKLGEFRPAARVAGIALQNAAIAEDRVVEPAFVGVDVSQKRIHFRVAGPLAERLMAEAGRLLPLFADPKQVRPGQQRVQRAAVLRDTGLGDRKSLREFRRVDQLRGLSRIARRPLDWLSDFRGLRAFQRPLCHSFLSISRSY